MEPMKADWTQALTGLDVQQLEQYPGLMDFVSDPAHAAIPPKLPPGTALIYVPSPPLPSPDVAVAQELKEPAHPPVAEQSLRKV